MEPHSRNVHGSEEETAGRDGEDIRTVHRFVVTKGEGVGTGKEWKAGVSRC